MIHTGFLAVSTTVLHSDVVIVCINSLFLNISDLFEKIVPIPVYDAMNVFEGRKSQITNMEIGRLREQTTLMNR